MARYLLEKGFNLTMHVKKVNISLKMNGLFSEQMPKVFSPFRFNI